MKTQFKIKKNLQQVALFASSVALSFTLLFLSSLVSKETRYEITETGAIVTELEFKQLKKAGKKVENNLTFLAFFVALLAVPPAAVAGLTVANRLPELEGEAADYNKSKTIRNIQIESDIATEQDICDINRNAAKTVHFKDVEKGFVALGQEAGWLSEPEQKRNLEPAPTQIPANPQQQALTPSQEALEEAEKKTPKTPGQRLLSDLAFSVKSMLVTGSTGAGKSHTLNAWLESVYAQARAKKQVAAVWVLGRKNDSFCGLREAGRLEKFNPTNVDNAFKLIKDFYDNYAIRVAETSEEERKQLPPLRLILEDWSIVAAVFQDYYPKLWSKIKLMLLDIITVGREYNVCLFILAQSLNLEALGLVGDANLRANMAIVAQGLVTEVFDPLLKEIKIQGDYGLVYLAIKNQYIVPNNDVRQTILAVLKQLEVESKAQQTPVFFTTLGGANVGLLPHIEKSTINFTPEERDVPITFDIKEFRESLIQQEQGMAIQPMQTQVIERPQMTRDEIVASLNRLIEPEEDKSFQTANEEPAQTPENEMISESFQDVKRPEGEESSDLESVYFTPMNLSREAATELVLRLKREMKHNQTEIISLLWNAKPGVTKAYKKALAEYKELTKDEENEN